MLSRPMNAFRVVAEELHFGRAAARLHISQPPLSQQIQQLERDVGARLFERTTRSVRLTSAGEFLAGHVRRLHAQGEEALDGVRHVAAGTTGSLTFGFTSSSAYRTLPLAIAAFRRAFPTFELRLREQNSHELWQGLLENSIDVALLRRNPAMLDRDVSFTSAGKERLVVAMRRDDSLARHQKVAVRDLKDLPLVGFSPTGSNYFHVLIGKLFANAKVPRTFVHESVMPTILSLVDAGVGVAVVPESASALWSERLAFRELRGPGAATRAEFHVARTPRRGNPAVDGLIEILATLATRSAR